MYYNKWALKLNSIALRSIDLLRNIKSDKKQVVIFDIDNTLLDSDGNRINPIVTMQSYYISTLQLLLVVLELLKTLIIIKKTNIFTFLKPLDRNVAQFKNNARMNLVEKGYDMEWDLDFEHGTPFKILSIISLSSLLSLILFIINLFPQTILQNRRRRW